VAIGCQVYLPGRYKNMKRMVVVVLGLALAAMGCGSDDNGGGAGSAGSGGAGGDGGGGGAGGAPGVACGDIEGGPLYDLSGGVFKVYNSLLDVDTGSGEYATDCAVPDLSGNLGANLTGIADKCLIIAPPDVSGCMQFEETSPGNFDVTGTQNLKFVIDVTIDAVAAQVVITTDSVTTFSGTGTGALPGTITMDALTAPFNVNAVASGTTNCAATNTATMADVSDAVCPLAGLMGGDNALPFPGDPGQRTFPPLAVTADTFEMGDGPTDATGYYLANPAPISGNGTQWPALLGGRLNPAP